MMFTPELLILGISASDLKNDGLIRFEYYCHAYGLKYQTIQTESDESFLELKKYIQHMPNRLLLICKTCDFYPLAHVKEIVDKYHQLSKKITGSNESIIVSQTQSGIDLKNIFSNSVAVIGYRDNIWRIFTSMLTIESKIELFDKIIVDDHFHLFQTLGNPDHLIVHKNRVYNSHSQSYPAFITADAKSRIVSNHISNYIETYPKRAYNIHEKVGYLSSCKVFIAAYINSAEKQELSVFLTMLQNLRWKDKQIHFYDTSNDAVDEIIKRIPGSTYYSNIKNYTFDNFIKTDSEYYLLIEQRAIITNGEVISELLTYTDNNHRIVSPLLHAINDYLYTNFWGDIDEFGYYKRSNNYIDLVEKRLRGLWNVPYVSSVILMHRSISDWNIFDKKSDLDIDMNLCSNIRNAGLFMFMINKNDYGYLLN